MYDENQIVKIKWNNTNRDWYESKGYKYTKRYDEFEVNAKDLSPTSNCKIKAVCDYCGSEFDTIYLTINNGHDKVNKDACSKCTGKKSSEVSRAKRAQKNFDILNEICQENDYILQTDISEFTDVKMNIKFICPKHGVQTMMLDNFKRGHKCIECSYETRFDNVKLSESYVNNTISSINNNKWLNPKEYKNSFERNILIQCECGNTYKTSFTSFLRHNINRCRTCSQKESIGELKIRKFLENNNIDYVQEKQFDDCVDLRSLPFDFYISSMNTCVEFDGSQHYYNVFGEDALEKTKRHDKIKNKYCEENNIKLIRIPFWDYENIETILTNELQLIG